MTPAHSLQEALERLGLAKRLFWREVERLLELAATDRAQTPIRPPWMAKFGPLTDEEAASMADIYQRLGAVVDNLMAEEAPLWARPHAKGRVQRVVEKLQIPADAMLRIPLREAE